MKAGAARRGLAIRFPLPRIPVSRSLKRFVNKDDENYGVDGVFFKRKITPQEDYVDADERKKRKKKRRSDPPVSKFHQRFLLE